MANENVQDSPYAAWLEGFIRSVMEHKPMKIGLCCLLEDGRWMTGYYGCCVSSDKAIMAMHINEDALMDTVFANAANILAAAEDEEEQDDEDP